MSRVKFRKVGESFEIPELTLDQITESKPVAQKVSNGPVKTADPLSLITPGDSFSVVTDAEFAPMVGCHQA